MIKVDIKGIERNKRRIIKTAQAIKSDTNNAVQQVAQVGFQYARNLAPEYTGALKAAMLVFPESNESWVILSGQPKGDLIPTHILFDLGIYPNPRRASSLGFMKQTADFLTREFSNRMKIAISHAIERNRNV